jgi:hypothetical protein
MNEQGLAAMSATPASQVTVEQVIQMLMQGANPEELAAQGIPIETIQQAMQMLINQTNLNKAD